MSASASEHELVYVSADAARTFTAAVLEKYGIPSENAKIIAGYLVEADLRGVDTHGMVRHCRLQAKLHVNSPLFLTYRHSDTTESFGTTT